MARELSVYISTPLGTTPIGGWRSTVIAVNLGFVARCNCGWVDARNYKTQDGADNRAQKHKEVHDDGLAGTAFEQPDIQDSGYRNWLKKYVKFI
jgi:hypothetical protein